MNFHWDRELLGE